MGIYIVAVTALLFLGFAYFAVGQASVARSGAQTAADASALAAARELRDSVHDAFLAALMSGDRAALGRLLLDPVGDGSPCGAAETYAADNKADLKVASCIPVDHPAGFSVEVVSRGTVGRSVVKGTENLHATARSTAVVEPRCKLDGEPVGAVVGFDCDDGPLDIDPTGAGFALDLSDFYTVHLSD